MTAQFEKAKAESKRIDPRINKIGLSQDVFTRAIQKEAEAFRNMVHEAGQKATGQTVDKILFSWEEK